MVSIGPICPQMRGAPIFYAQLVACGCCAKVPPRHRNVLEEAPYEPSRPSRPSPGPAGLARHGPEGARRRLRPGGLCAEPRPGAQAQPVQQRPRARAARCAEAPRLWHGRGREARPVRDVEAQCADQHLHPRRRLASASGEGLCVHGRDDRARRRPLDRPRLRRRRGDPGQSAADGRPGAPRGGLGLQECEKLRRRSRAYLCHQPVVRRPSRRQRRHHRLERVWRARKRGEGRAHVLGHVRPQAGAAVEALRIRGLHRRDGGEAFLDPPSRPAQLPADRRLRHLRDAGIPAAEPRVCRRREGRRQAGHAAGGRRLQPFRDDRDDRQSAERDRQRGAGADEACSEDGGGDGHDAADGARERRGGRRRRWQPRRNRRRARRARWSG